MNYSLTTTQSTAFTMTHAYYLAVKVTTDLKRMQRFYDKPTDVSIEDYEKEIMQLINSGFLKKIFYGFQRDGQWIEPTLIYTAEQLNNSVNDDPGKIKPGKNIRGAFFHSFLEYSNDWYGLSDCEKAEFEKKLPFKRTNGNIPEINGYLERDLSYSSGGKSLSRSSVRSYE